MKLYKNMMRRYMAPDDATGGTGGAAVTETTAAAAATTAESTATTSLLAAGAAEPNTATFDYIPEKLRVNKEDGSFDLEGSSRKMSEAYGALEKRFGSGDVPPKDAGEYKITVPDALKEAFDPATDEGMKGFLGKAHAAGMTQGQIDLVMGQYFDMAPKLVAGSQQFDKDTATTELKKTWATDADFSRNVRNAYVGASAAAQKAGLSVDAVMSGPLANNPDFLRLMAALGPEFSEDPGAGGHTMTKAEDIDTLMRSEAYANPQHKDYAKVSAQVRTYFERKHGTEAAA